MKLNLWIGRKCYLGNFWKKKIFKSSCRNIFGKILFTLLSHIQSCSFWYVCGLEEATWDKKDFEWPKNFCKSILIFFLNFILLATFFLKTSGTFLILYLRISKRCIDLSKLSLTCPKWPKLVQIFLDLSKLV